MNKAKKLAELITPYDIHPRPTNLPKVDTDDTLSVLAKLIKRITTGAVSGNPYSWPEIIEALELLAQKQGITDKYDVNLDKFIKR